MMGNLFNKIFLTEFITFYRKQLAEHIDKLEILGSTDIPALVNHLVEKYRIEPIALGEPEPYEPKEVMVQKANPWGQYYSVKIFEIRITISYTGNKDLFYCHPSHSTVVYLDDTVDIRPGVIRAKIVLDKLDPDAYQAAVNGIIGKLQSNLPTIHDEIAPWNTGLESLVESSLQARKGVVDQKFDFMKKIGLKVNEGAEYLIPPTVVKKAIPVPVSDTSTHIKREQIPTLEEKVYKDIREVLHQIGKSMERKPSLYLGKHEEDLRDVFLMYLETRYESATGVGEAFNKSGKTDILLKYAKDGSNIFVAECKFWRGQKSFLSALDQLLNYLTHRDSKTALIVFVDQKEFTSVLTTIKTEITNHPHYLRLASTTYADSLNYEFSLPQDSKKVIQIEVMLFHFPKG